MVFIIMWVISIIENVSPEALSESEGNQYYSSKFSIGFYLLLPVAGLSLLILGRRDIFGKLIIQLLDRKYLSVVCPCFIKKESLINWACSRLPPTWSSNSARTLSGGIKELWTDGSLLCTLINTAIPGACPNPHRHWKQSPVHGQALAYKYFGIIPIFTNDDFKRNLRTCLERKFIRYLNEVQESVNKISENTEKESKISSRYIVRGMGIFSGEQHKKTTFYVYLNENSEDDDDKNSNIIIQIKGPYGTYGEAVAPKLINKHRKFIRNKIKQERRQSIQFIENLMHSNAWNFTRSQKKNIDDSIDVEATLENDRIKVTYIPTNYGMYDINMIANGELIRGCPFSVHIFINEKNIEETEEKLPKQKKIRKPLIKENILLEVPENDDIKQKTNLKLTFNFKEVVEEITKNGKVFKNILGHTPEREMSNLEITACTDDKNNNKELKHFDRANQNIVKKHTHEINDIKLSNNINFTNNDQHFYDSLDATKISSSFDHKKETHYVDKETIFIDKKQLTNNTDNNDNSDSKQISDGSNNIKINNVKSTSIFANKNLINESEKSQLEGKHKSFIFEPKYINTVNINKIKIPAMFITDEGNNFSYKLQDKYFKNILNESNKVFSNTEVSHKYDILNNTTIIELENNKINKEVNPNNNFNPQILEKYPKITSPICLEHIVPEVENKFKTVAEKRKIFAQHSLGSAFNSSSKNSSFSDENENDSTDRKYEKEGLGVLNILNNLQGSVLNSSTDTWSLCSTVSLPNLSLESDCYQIISIKDKKTFWENVSSRSSSTKSLWPKKMSELERNKLIWKKSDDSFNTYNNVYQAPKVYKSADDILSIINPCEQQTIKYSSVDDISDNYVVLSIEERKKMLLKQSYQQEKMNRRVQLESVSIKDNQSQKPDKVEDINVKLDFTPLSEKIKKYNSALELSSNNTEESCSKSIKKLDEVINPSIQPEKTVLNKQNISNVHFEFKKAINYFKNLETQSKVKTIKPKRIPKNENQKSELRYRKGGSLNLPKVSQKYLIKNLYQDVFGNMKSNFRGTPNKSALVEALATLPRNKNLVNDNDENDIKFDIFKRFKSRKRKSLKSIFDIHY